jgi:hypothetical protein
VSFGDAPVLSCYLYEAMRDAHGVSTLPVVSTFCLLSNLCGMYHIIKVKGPEHIMERYAERFGEERLTYVGQVSQRERAKIVEDRKASGVEVEFLKPFSSEEDAVSFMHVMGVWGFVFGEHGHIL